MTKKARLRSGFFAFGGPGSPAPEEPRPARILRVEKIEL
jgi:hypothetical protein